MKKELYLLQAIGWIISFSLFYLYLSARLGSGFKVFFICLTAFIFFICIIYGYIFYLHPRFFHKLTRGGFIIVVAAFFILIVGIRLLVEYLFLAPFGGRYTIFTLGRIHLMYGVLSSFFALILGILLRLVIDSVDRQREEAEMKRKHTEAELNLLKAQLQPHFLFNSLNNLYYDVYKKLPLVANRVAMLSEIMRYFMDHSKKEKVPLKLELEFIRNYIELERIRLHHPPSIHFEVKAPEGLLIPPMLLMPFIENLFKHGVRQDKKTEQMSILVLHQNERLVLEVMNSLQEVSLEIEKTGVGLNNLRERLQLLYGNGFELNVEVKENKFISRLNFPAYEN